MDPSVVVEFCKKVSTYLNQIDSEDYCVKKVKFCDELFIFLLKNKHIINEYPKFRMAIKQKLVELKLQIKNSYNTDKLEEIFNVDYYTDIFSEIDSPKKVKQKRKKFVIVVEI